MSANAEKIGKSDITTEAELPGRLEYTFQELADYAVNEGLFDWILDGKETTELVSERVTIELNHDAISKFGLLLRKYAPTKETGSFRLSLSQKCDSVARARTERGVT